jgi:conjugative transfer signal peptidase TraF
LLVNVTASIPRGVYWIRLGSKPHRGDLVALPIPRSVRGLLHERQYVPRSIDLLAKPVAASSGDHVCVQAGTLAIDGQFLAHVLGTDRHGRSLPQVALCRELGPDEVFLAIPQDNSFDSRHFGPIAREDLLGTLTPLVTF